ncbi:UNVERIFIED_CONTAM: hypothetical protein GTU68_005274, partial [Idotea baltica]|nr:hypothetical protein [Idotea baltica]
MKHLVRAFLWDQGGNPNKRNGDDETAIHCVCKVGQVKSPSAKERRAMCLSILLMWRGPMNQDGDKE